MYIVELIPLIAIALSVRCLQIIVNPPFNVDKVKAEAAQNAGRLPFGLPAVNDSGEFGNANYLWISYFYAYLNEHGRAGFVMASSATDSQRKDKDIREQLIRTGHVDVMISVGNNFFYLMGMGRGSTNQQELYRNVIEELEILLPSEEILANAEAALSAFHDRITALNNQITRLSEARDRLLPKLMSGEIAV